MGNAHTVWANATTQSVTFGDVKVGDAVFLPGPVGDSVKRVVLT